MTNLLLILLLQVATVASFAPKLQHFHPCHHTHYDDEHKDKDDGNTKRIFSNAPALQYSLTADDWHTAAQLHPLDNLGVIDDESSSAIMMMGQTDISRTTSGSRSGAAASHHSEIAAVTNGADMMREFMEAFFPVIVLILLEIYSQQILQFPLA
ncbi:hypothetical protein QTG54_005549 [Skeletonema marinoi]|uniref:Uncharacterized protein n=1 Tax=Skeletonema marinoi TaxID=267567 RepID=A0AAD9DE46_9STRA|nr:hypothetical protein QTG54_005549 [Skeletonema marinoi]